MTRQQMFALLHEPENGWKDAETMKQAYEAFEGRAVTKTLREACFDAEDSVDAPES